MFMRVDVISLKATCLPNGKIPIGNLFLYLISITNLFEIEILSTAIEYLIAKINSLIKSNALCAHSFLLHL